MSALYAQPAQSAPSTAFTCVRQPAGCHYQPHPAFGHSPVQWTDHHEQPVYANGIRLEPQPFNQAQMLSGRPVSMQPQSMLGQQHASPQQLISGMHSWPASQHQAFVPAGQPAVQHLQAQPTDTSFALQAATACRQLGTQAAANSSSLQHASPALGLHGVPPWQHDGSALPRSSSPLLHHALLPAAASSTAPAHCQPHFAVPPQHAAALGAPLHPQCDVAAQSASMRQLPELVRCPSQSMPAPHDPTPHLPPTSLGTGPLGAAKHFADSMAGQMTRQSLSAAMLAVQEPPLDSTQPSLLQLQQPAMAAGQRQQQSSLPLTSGRPALNSLPALPQLAAPGQPGPAPLPGPHATGPTAPSSAAGLTLLGTMVQGQPAILPSATDAACDASAPISPTHAAGSISIPHPVTAGHTAALPTHHSDSRPPSVSIPAYAALPADMVRPSTMPMHIARPGEMLAAASMPAQAQDLPSPSGMPGQATAPGTSPQLRQTIDACASTENFPAAASLPVGMGQAGISTEQVASDPGFRFQPQPNCIQVSAGVCCTPVLRPRSQGVAYAGMSLTMYLSSVEGARHVELLSKVCKSCIGTVLMRCPLELICIYCQARCLTHATVLLILQQSMHPVTKARFVPNIKLDTEEV